MVLVSLRTFYPPLLHENERNVLIFHYREADGQTMSNLMGKKTPISIHEEMTLIMTLCDSVELEPEPSWLEGREVMTRGEYLHQIWQKWASLAPNKSL